MNNIISYNKYYRYKSLSLPIIIYFIDKNEPQNKKILEKMDYLCNIYPYVLCYKTEWEQAWINSKTGILRNSSDILCFKNNKILCYISCFNEEKLHNLFKLVHNECVINHCKVLNRMLISEKRIIIGHKHDLYNIENEVYNMFDIVAFDKKVIEKCKKRLKLSINGTYDKSGSEIDSECNKINLISEIGERYRISNSSNNQNRTYIKPFTSQITSGNVKDVPDQLFNHAFVNQIDFRNPNTNLTNSSKINYISKRNYENETNIQCISKIETKYVIY